MPRKRKKTRTKKTPKANGRPRASINWQLVDALCAAQATQVEIAAVLMIDPDTLANAVQREKRMGFSEYFSTKRTGGLGRLKAKQLQVAFGDPDAGLPPNPTMLIFLGKQLLGQRDKHEHTGKDGGPIEQAITIEKGDLSTLTDEELDQLETLSKKIHGNGNGKSEPASASDR